MDLSEFLAARFNEDEATARAACIRRISLAWKVDSEEWAAGVGIIDGAGKSVAVAHGSYRAEHIARWDPARVLGELKAKRRMAEWAFEYGADVDHERGDNHDADKIRRGACHDRGAEAACDVLMMLAAPYADHPDFDPAWVIDAAH